MSAVDDGAAEQVEKAPEKDTTEKAPESAATVLVKLALDRHRLGLDDLSRPAAEPTDGAEGVAVVRPLRGGRNSLRGWLSQAYFTRTGKVPPQQALADALVVLEGMAEDAGRLRPLPAPGDDDTSTPATDGGPVVSESVLDADDCEVVPAPTQPMRVVRHLQPDFEHEGQPTLRSWRGSWMRWQRTHWAEVEEQAVRSKLYRRLEHVEYEAVTPKGEVERRPWAPTKRKVADLLDALASVTHLPATIDAPTWTDRRDEGTIVACSNGLLRVADRKLLEHDPRFFNLVSTPFDYDPEATEPKRWLDFLDGLWPDDPDAIKALQEWFGYVVSGRTDLHKIMLIVGPTRSGKGTIARILTALVGKGNMAGPTLASIATNFGLSPLLGKPLAIVSDARLGGANGGHQVVERLLTISGEDTIDVDRKHRDPWTGRLPTRFLILSNELPNFGDASGAIAHRFIVLTMQRSWLGQENTALTGQLIEELPGILNWALDGLARLVGNGRFTEPASSTDAVIAMKDSASPMSAFVRECCETGADKEVRGDVLYKAWKKWCEDNGRDRPGSAQMFGRNLQSVVPQARRFRPRAEKGRQVLTYLGIGLKPDAIPRETDESKSRNGEHRVSPRLTDSDRDSESGVSRLSRGETRSNPLQLLHRTSLSGHACRVCGEAIDPAAGDVHPGCDTEVPR